MFDSNKAAIEKTLVGFNIDTVWLFMVISDADCVTCTTVYHYLTMVLQTKDASRIVCCHFSSIIVKKNQASFDLSACLLKLCDIIRIKITICNFDEFQVPYEPSYLRSSYNDLYICFKLTNVYCQVAISSRGKSQQLRYMYYMIHFKSPVQKWLGLSRILLV